MKSKHKAAVLAFLSKTDIRSTNEIVKEIKEKSGKTVNWYVIHRILSDLKAEKKVEELKSKGGIYWRLA